MSHIKDMLLYLCPVSTLCASTIWEWDILVEGLPQTHTSLPTGPTIC